MLNLGVVQPVDIPSLNLSDDYQRLTKPYTQELLVHCYRILGSLEDAEDALQEALLRAWRRLDTLKAQGSLRAWLYKIATNVSLDMLDQRKARTLPALAFPPASPGDPLPNPIADPIWLDPLPDEYLAGLSASPDALYDVHESVSLAFLAVLQYLPGRQRAVLILRDVLGWKAQEAAELLEISLPAANSALQRARATLKKHPLDLTQYRPATDVDQQITNLLSEYVQAWENADAARLVGLLRQDAVMTMPPLPAWYRGLAAIREFLETYLFVGETRGRFRLIPTRANGCPAFAMYQRGQDGKYRTAALHVLRISQGQIAQIDDFLTSDTRLFSRFRLPLTS
jgi:RNA polymerase sigma-70 factor (ECF subfamily)